MSGGGEAGRGSLIAVGTGIRIVGQLTTEAIAWMKRADRVLYLVADRVSEETIRRLNPGRTESLSPLYAEGKPRLASYHEMVMRILSCVRSEMVTCVATYGHPGVFADPVHEAIRRARDEGYSARMLPAISAEDCLFADMGVDPARSGCQSYDATDFLIHGRIIDPSAAVVLWQIGVVGDPLFRRGGYDLSVLPVLVEWLCRFHPPDHLCYVYEAAVYPGTEPSIRSTSIRALPELALSVTSTLYIPPSRKPIPDPAVRRRIESLLPASASSPTPPQGQTP